MKRTFSLLILIACSVWAASPQAKAQVTVNVDQSKNWLGYMNVSELPANGGGVLWGSPWGTIDLVAEFSGSTLTLSPNTIGDPNEYWYQCTGSGTAPDCGSPGALGNKIMEANMYVEETDTYAGQTVTFEGTVLSNTFTSAHESIAFIKDFASDYSSFNLEFAYLDSPGPFSLSLATDSGPGRHVQYGFATTGENVWVTDVAPYGNIMIEAVGSPAIPGDFDGDSDVDGHDFMVWQRDQNVGTLQEWQDNYRAPQLAAVTAVPEPATCILAMLLAIGVPSMGRRR